MVCGGPAPQHFFHFFPELQGHGWLRPTFCALMGTRPASFARQNIETAKT
jgi:hypothetical protein